MKQFLAALLALACFGLLCGCTVDGNAGKRPSSQDGTRWVARELDMVFIVDNAGAKDKGANCYGTLTIDGETIEFFIAFDYGSGADFYPLAALKTSVDEDGNQPRYIDGNEGLFSGTCRFSPKKLVVDIARDPTGLLAGDSHAISPQQPYRLTFDRDDSYTPPQAANSTGVMPG